MTFAHPIAWYLALLAIPIILFYILKIRLRQEPVSTTIFWQQVFEERRSRSFWRRLRHLVSLILSLLFLALLVGAVLDPIPGFRQKAARCVIVVDNSAGMKARSAPGAPTRLEHAKTELAGLLKTTDIARQTAVLSAGGAPKIVVGFTDHLGTLRRGIDSIPATDYPTGLSDAIALARQLIAGEENSAVLVYTDGCEENLDELQRLPNVHFCPIGEPMDNIGITRFQPRRSLGDAVGYEILVEAANFGTQPVAARLEIELEDRVIDVIPLTLEPGKPLTRIVRDATSQGGLLRATLKPTESAEDLFPTDNTAIAFLSPRSLQHVYLYGEEDFFLLKVLQSQPNVELHFLAEIPKTVPGDGVLVLHQAVPETIPAGKVLMVDPRGASDLFELGEPLEVPIVAQQVEDSPLLKFVHLKNLLIPGARTVMPKAEFESRNLAETPEGAPIYLHWDLSGRDVLLLTADLKRGDLALRTAFPIMVSQALQRFRGSGGELEKAYSTAEAVRVELMTAGDRVILKSPSGALQSYPVKQGLVSLGALPECGVWEISEPTDTAATTPDPLLRLACNLSDVRESHFRLAPDSFYSQTPDAAALRTGVRPVWYWLALIALFFTTLEWFLYQRRWVD